MTTEIERGCRIFKTREKRTPQKENITTEDHTATQHNKRNGSGNGRAKAFHVNISRGGKKGGGHICIHGFSFFLSLVGLFFINGNTRIGESGPVFFFLSALYVFLSVNRSLSLNHTLFFFPHLVHQLLSVRKSIMRQNVNWLALYLDTRRLTCDGCLSLYVM